MTPLSKKSPVLLVENSKSHGSVTVRFGAIIFGLGTFVYFFIELLDFLQIKMCGIVTYFNKKYDPKLLFLIEKEKSEKFG